MEDVTAAGQSGVQLGLYSRLGHRGQLSSKGRGRSTALLACQQCGWPAMARGLVTYQR